MTIAEIKQVMTDAFISNPDVIEKYGLEAGKTFDEQFSAVSIESILFFDMATAVWLSFQMFEQHKADVSEMLAGNRVHTNRWYAMKALSFRYGQSLIPDTDTYDSAGLTGEQIEASHVVKFAAAVQPRDKSVLYLNVATEVNGKKQPLSGAQLTALTAYFNEISDAGVRYAIINAPADRMRLELDIYYNPLLLDDEGRRLDGSGDTVIQDTVRSHIGSLPFNGMYTNQALVDALQNVDGVEQAELKGAYSKYGAYADFRAIDGRSIPHAGYYDIDDANLILNFIANEEYL
ncbi:MAG: hypothetical protein LBL33_08735 [Tannerella sp.]|jgi:hypothetical protein|nr:hypothetical protein [Tannerella sp.]